MKKNTIDLGWDWKENTQFSEPGTRRTARGTSVMTQAFLKTGANNSNQQLEEAFPAGKYIV